MQTGGVPVHRRHRRNIYLSAERLEPRRVLSVDFSALSAGTVGQIDWQGQAVEAFQDRWIVGFEATASSLPPVEPGWSITDLGGGFFSLGTHGTSGGEVSWWATSTPGVTSIEPDFALTPTRLPNDPSFELLWGLSNTGQTGGLAGVDINAPEAWDITTGSRSVVIAVVDSGVDISHPDLAANIWRNPGEIPGNGIDDDRNGYVDDVSGWDFVANDNTPDDGNGHGTHVAGTIGGVGNDGRGVVGVNWEVSILPLKFLDELGFGSTAGAIAALNYATTLRNAGVNIVATNNSWGGGGYSAALRAVIARHDAAGMLFVAAAGNDGSDNDVAPAYPASYDLPNVIAVAAIDHADQAASFSNYGRTTVDLAAPGVDVYSSIPGGGYASFSGTSMAAPHVSGVVGLLAAANPQATAAELRAAILDTTAAVPGLAGRTATGGRLDAAAALDQIAPVAGPRVVSVVPAGVVPPPLAQLEVVFDEEIHSASLIADNFTLVGAGVDEAWGTGDDLAVAIPPTGIAQASPGTVVIELGTALVDGAYRLTLRGTGPTPIQNLAGEPLRGGSDASFSFAVRTPPPAPLEPNDTIATATPALLDADTSVFSGVIGDGEHGPRDVDLFAFELEAGDLLEVVVTAAAAGSSLDSYVNLFDAGGVLWASNDDSGGSLDSSLSFVAPITGGYLVGVSGLGNSHYLPESGDGTAAGSTGPYEVRFRRTTPTGEANDSIFEAKPVPVLEGTTSLDGEIGDGEYGDRDVDFFAVSMLVGQRLELAVVREALDGEFDGWLRVFDVMGEELAVGSSLVFVAPESAGYFVGVSGRGNTDYSPFLGGSGTAGSTGRFRLDVTLSEFIPSPLPVREPGGTIAEAVVGLAAGRTTASVAGVIGDGPFAAADVDLYAVSLAAGDLLELAVRASWLNSPLDSYLRLFDAAGEQVAANDDFQGSLDSGLAFITPESGTYYVGVSGYGNRQYSVVSEAGQAAGSTGDYQLDLHRTPAPINVSPDSNDSLATAEPLAIGPGGATRVVGIIGDGRHGARDVDLYSMRLAAGQTLTLSSTAVAGGLLDSYLRLFDATGRELAADDDAAGWANSFLAFTATASGTYFVGVSGFRNTRYRADAAGSGLAGSIGSYWLDVTLSAAPAISAPTAATGPASRSSAADLFRLIGILASQQESTAGEP
jgi:subtilisin family serine protease